MFTSTLQTRAETVQVLRHSPILALRRLALEETETTVTLHGKVPSYYLKQLAQETLRPVLAGRQLLNQIEVVKQSPQPV